MSSSLLNVCVITGSSKHLDALYQLLMTSNAVLASVGLNASLKCGKLTHYQLPLYCLKGLDLSAQRQVPYRHLVCDGISSCLVAGEVTIHSLYARATRHYLQRNADQIYLYSDLSWLFVSNLGLTFSCRFSVLVPGYWNYPTVFESSAQSWPSVATLEWC